MKTNEDPWKKGSHANLIEACKLHDVIPIQHKPISTDEMFCAPISCDWTNKGSKEIIVLLKPKI